jgi:hypothetical protein
MAEQQDRQQENRWFKSAVEVWLRQNWISKGNELPVEAQAGNPPIPAA